MQIVKINSINRLPTPAAIQEARSHPNGWVYQVDFDYLPNDYVPPEAIEGAWKVNANGEIEGSFEPNAGYRPIEISMKKLPAYMMYQRSHEAGMWIVEMDHRVEHMFPAIPKEAYIGYWLIGADGNITAKFRPSATYSPEHIALLIATKE